MNNGLKKMMNGKFIKSVFEVIKFSLCFYISISAIFGFVMAKQGLSIKAILLGFFVLLLALGCAALNNIQDKEYDASFLRTCTRVLVVKRIEVQIAFFISFSCIITGLFGLFFFFESIYPFVYGLLALVCYNLLYTPLKKHTLLSIIPGTMTGMLPPLIGWAAANSYTMNHTIIIIMIVLGVWQIPHFFLILLNSENNLNDNKYPNFRNVFTKTDLKLQTLIWCGLYSLSMFFYLISRSCNSFYLSVIIAINATAIVFFISIKLFFPGKSDYFSAFVAINISILIFMAIGILGIY